MGESFTMNRIAILFVGVSSLGKLHDRVGQRKYLNQEERRAFRKAIDELDDPIQQAFCLTMFHTGCRISEALALTADKIDSSEGKLVFRTLKQRKEIRFRAIPIPPALLQALVIQPIEADRRLFPFCRTKAWEVIKNLMATAGLAGIKATPKGLRHAYAIACVSANIPLPKLQKWMGHSKLKTTAIYLDYVGDEDQELVQKLGSIDDCARLGFVTNREDGIWHLSAVGLGYLLYLAQVEDEGSLEIAQAFAAGFECADSDDP